MLFKLITLFFLFKNVYSYALINIYDNNDYNPHVICPYNNNYTSWHIQHICLKEYGKECEELTKKTYNFYIDIFNLEKSVNNCWILHLKFINPKIFFNNKIQDIIYYLNFSTHSYQFELFHIKFRYNPKFAPSVDLLNTENNYYNKLPINIIINGGIYDVNKIKLYSDDDNVILDKRLTNYYTLDIIESSNVSNLFTYFLKLLTNYNSENEKKFILVLDNNFMITRYYEIFIDTSMKYISYKFDNYRYIDYFEVTTPTYTTYPSQTYLRKK